MYQPYNTAQKAQDYAGRIAKMKKPKAPRNSVPLPYYPGAKQDALQQMPHRPDANLDMAQQLPYAPTGTQNTGITGGMSLPNSSVQTPQQQLEMMRRYQQLRMMGY